MGTNGQKQQAPIIQIRHLKNYLGGQWVHEDVNLDVYPREVVGIVGGSGSGKTTILRCILGLLQPTGGDIHVFNTDVLHCSTDTLKIVQRRWGMMFQQSALFSSLTVLQNVMYPLREFTDLNEELIREIACLKISLVGLPISAANKFPSELSGGMQKRAAAARAIALDPEIVFLDEPSAGLDPKSAEGLDELIVYLRDSLDLTIVLVTHDLDTLWQATDRVAFLGEGKVLACEPIRELVNNPSPLITNYFSGKRGHRFIELLGTE